MDDLAEGYNNGLVHPHQQQPAHYHSLGQQPAAGSGDVSANSVTIPNDLEGSGLNSPAAVGNSSHIPTPTDMVATANDMFAQPAIDDEEVEDDDDDEDEDDEEEDEEGEEELGGQSMMVDEDEEMQASTSSFSNVAQGLEGRHRDSMLQYWQDTINSIEHDDHKFKIHQLPLARIKKVMKADEDVRMISAEAPILFAKGCDIFITELTMRAWIHAEENKRRTLQRSDIANAVQKSDMFDFLIDIVPREEAKRGGTSANAGQFEDEAHDQEAENVAQETLDSRLQAEAMSNPQSHNSPANIGMRPEEDLLHQQYTNSAAQSSTTSPAEQAPLPQEPHTAPSVTIPVNGQDHVYQYGGLEYSNHANDAAYRAQY